MRRGLIVLCLWLACLHAGAETLVLAYPERQRLPFMAEAPSNEGIYRDVFSRAAALIGYELTILRLPKKRLFQYMREGRVDLYPGSFSRDRVATMNWMEFGLMTKEVCITRDEVPPIDDLAKAPPLRLLHEIGDSRAGFNKLYPNLTPVEFGARIDLDLAVTLLKGRRGDLFIIEKQPLQHYLAIHKLASLNEIGLTYHEHCIGREQPVLLGFARASKYYAERLNPEYERSRPLAPGNLPTVIDERSVAGQLRQALKEMEARGEIRRIIAAHTESP